MQNFLKEKLSGLKQLKNSRLPVLTLLAIAVTVAGILFYKSVNTVRINDGIKTYVVSSLSGDTDKALLTAGFKPGEYRVLSSTKRGNQIFIAAQRTFPVNITVGEKTVRVNTQKATVNQILKGAGFTVDEYDLISPAADTLIEKPCYIEYTDINVETVETTEEIPCGTKTVYSKALAVGATTTVPGTNGIKKSVYTIKTVNGVETEKTLTEDTVIQNPVDTLTTIGTKAISVPTATAAGGHVYDGCLTKYGGVYKNPYTGLRETYYSQKVLPGGALVIPGRHVNESGLVCDGDGYICVASNDFAKGTIIETSLGMGKVYDCGCARGTLDVYVNW